MIEFFIATTLFWGLCAGLGVAASSDREIVNRGYFHVGSLVIVAASAWYMTLATAHCGFPQGAALVAIFLIIVGSLLLIPWFKFLLGHYIEGGQRWLVGIDSMKVQRSFDLADRAARERRFDDAARLYLDEAARDPGNPDPLRQAAECRLEVGDVEDAVRLLQEAHGATKAIEDRASLAFRVAELLERRLGRREAAGRILEAAVLDLAGTRFATYAKDRLNLLTSPGAPRLSSPPALPSFSDTP